MILELVCVKRVGLKHFLRGGGDLRRVTREVNAVFRRVVIALFLSSGNVEVRFRLTWIRNRLFKIGVERAFLIHFVLDIIFRLKEIKFPLFSASV